MNTAANASQTLTLQTNNERYVYAMRYDIYYNYNNVYKLNWL